MWFICYLLSRHILNTYHAEHFDFRSFAFDFRHGFTLEWFFWDKEISHKEIKMFVLN